MDRMIDNLDTYALYMRCVRRALMEVYDIDIQELIRKIIEALAPTHPRWLDETRQFLARFDEYGASDPREVINAFPNIQTYVKIFLKSHGADSEEVRMFQAVWGRGVGSDVVRPKPALPEKRLNAQMAPSPEDAACDICLHDVEMGELVAVLPCGHWYHVSCVKPWVYRHNTCPMDRRKVYGFPEDMANVAIHFGMIPRWDDSDDSE